MFTHFYSDPHFGHRSVIPFAKRPFVDLYDMEKELIERYNEVVGEDDTVLWLGDCFWSAQAVGVGGDSILARMNGRKVLVKGNHDGTDNKMLSLGFDAVVDHLYIRLGGRVCLCAHLPLDDPRDPKMKRRYDKMYVPVLRPREVLIHGHIHTRDRRRNKQIHVGVDAWDYYPASRESVERLVLEV